MTPAIGRDTVLHIDEHEIPCRTIRYRRYDGQERLGLYGDPWLSYEFFPGDSLTADRQYVVEETALFQSDPGAEYDDPVAMVENMGTFLVLKEMNE